MSSNDWPIVWQTVWAGRRPLNLVVCWVYGQHPALDTFHGRYNSKAPSCKVLRGVHSAGEAFIRDQMKALCSRGARLVRLDAFGYATKKRGTPCFFEVRTFSKTKQKKHPHQTPSMHSARELLECMFLQFWDALVAGVVGDKLSPSEQASKENTACPFLVNGDSFAHSNLNAIV